MVNNWANYCAYRTNHLFFVYNADIRALGSLQLGKLQQTQTISFTCMLLRMNNLTATDQGKTGKKKSPVWQTVASGCKLKRYYCRHVRVRPRGKA